MDIIGPLPMGRLRLRYILVLVDYFTKWVEVEAYAKVTDQEVMKFVWKNIICRFDLPQEIVTDNSSQFISFKFQDFCKGYGIQLSFATPRYPQFNGQAESTNKTLLKSIKRRLGKTKK